MRLGIAGPALGSSGARVTGPYRGLTIAPNYWIDTTLGNDANPGTSASPWKTLSKITNVLLNGSDTVSFRVRAGTYADALDYITVNNSGDDNAVMNIVFEPGCIMDGTAANAIAATNGLEFNGTSTWTSHVYGNGLTIRDYSEATGLSPNGVGNRDSHTLYIYDVTTINCDDGLSGHGDSRIYAYDCTFTDAEKGTFAHVDNCQTYHYRCTFTARAAATLGVGGITSATAPAVFEDCVFIPATSGQALDLRGATLTRCQIGTTSASVAISGSTTSNLTTISNSYVNLYADGNLGLVMSRCWGLYSARVRNGGLNDVDNCVFSGPATGQTAILFSNFTPGSSTQFRWRSNIFETASALAFMNIDATNAGYLVTASAQMFNNILSGSAAFDADLIAADTGPTVRVANVTADALIGAANTLLAADYGYASGSPAIGAGVGGTNSGFPAAQAGMVRQVRSPPLP